MDDDVEPPRAKKVDGQVTLSEMLKALDKNVATGIEKKLKRLSKKKAIEKPLDEHKAAQVSRIDAYSEAKKEVSKWDPIVESIRRAPNLTFPLDQEPDHLPASADCLSIIKPRNDLEREVTNLIEENAAVKLKESILSKTEERYQKAISVEAARDRHKELQRMRIKLNTFAAKMRRQKSIKSKSYHRLLKQERIKKHIKRVESNQDALLDEIERLQKLRAQERASLKHKNTGKWAKHAKFRSKYDEEARQAMLEQIGIAGKLLEKPAVPQSDSDEEEDEDEDEGEDEDEVDEDGDSESEEESVDANSRQADADEISEVDELSNIGDDAASEDKTVTEADARLIVSSELINNRVTRKKTPASDGLNESDCEEDDDENEQRKLMSEAFANDDVVGDFKKTKDQLAKEEQPEDIDTFLPGWGDWAGPGIKVSKRTRQKYIIKAKKIKRRDENLGNVIISEKADEVINELRPKELPRCFRNANHMKRVLTRPTASSFVNQTDHRELIRPKIQTRMGKRIEPIGQHMLCGGSKASWA